MSDACAAAESGAAEKARRQRKGRTGLGVLDLARNVWRNLAGPRCRHQRRTRGERVVSYPSALRRGSELVAMALPQRQPTRRLTSRLPEALLDAAEGEEDRRLRRPWQSASRCR